MDTIFEKLKALKRENQKIINTNNNPYADVLIKMNEIIDSLLTIDKLLRKLEEKYDRSQIR